jgi:beta-xylosidase
MTKVPLLMAGVLAAIGGAAPAAAPAPVHTPVFRQDFADPFIVEHKGEYLAYSTNSGANLPIATSRDLVNWTLARDATRPGKPLDGMPQLGSWVRKGLTWAPEVLEVDGRWLLYYTARDQKRNLQCIGLAIASDPRGPFQDRSNRPLVCQTELGGTIDANPFRDADGKLYLYYKNDGNAVRKSTEIWAHRLSPDGASLVGEAVSMGLKNDRPWEAHVIEAPTMVRRPGGYTMLYSAHHFGWEQDQRLSPYAMGYARCSTPMGPCTDGADNPVLYSYNGREAGCLSGPGHQSVFNAGGREYISFHGWAATSGCRKADQKRFFYIAPLSWKDGKPLIGPSLRARPAETRR